MQKKIVAMALAAALGAGIAVLYFGNGKQLEEATTKKNALEEVDFDFELERVQQKIRRAYEQEMWHTYKKVIPLISEGKFDEAEVVSERLGKRGGNTAYNGHTILAQAYEYLGKQMKDRGNVTESAQILERAVSHYRRAGSLALKADLDVNTPWDVESASLKLARASEGAGYILLLLDRKEDAKFYFREALRHRHFQPESSAEKIKELERLLEK